MSAAEKIISIKEKMSGLEQGSPMYNGYQEIIKELEATIEKPKIVVHKSVEPEICESCQ